MYFTGMIIWLQFIPSLGTTEVMLQVDALSLLNRLYKILKKSISALNAEQVNTN